MWRSVVVGRDSIESLVRGAHRRLDALFAELLDACARGADLDPVHESFARLREALEAHLAQEDRLYYPALRALRPAHRRDLLGFAQAHDAFRIRLAELEAALRETPPVELQVAIGETAREFAQHEHGEERLLRRIDDELRAGEDAPGS